MGILIVLRDVQAELPTMAEWKTGEGLQGYDTLFFIDGSKMVNGAVAGPIQDCPGYLNRSHWRY